MNCLVVNQQSIQSLVILSIILKLDGHGWYLSIGNFTNGLNLTKEVVESLKYMDRIDIKSIDDNAKIRIVVSKNIKNIRCLYSW